MNPSPALCNKADQILHDNKRVIKKQRHTAKRIYTRLRDEHGFTRGITIVTDYVRYSHGSPDLELNYNQLKPFSHAARLPRSVVTRASRGNSIVISN